MLWRKHFSSLQFDYKSILNDEIRIYYTGFAGDKAKANRGTFIIPLFDFDF